MKLRNFMYATMIACAFASCSKDDVIEGGQEPVAKAGSITISVKSKAQTKALASDAENTTGTVALYLYKKTGTSAPFTYTLIDSHDLNNTTETSWTIEELEAGTYTCFGYANMSGATIADPTKPENVVVEITGAISESAIPMSGFGEATLSGGGSAECIVNLIRNAARIDLVSVSLGMAYRDVDKYPTGTAYFQYKGVSVNNVPTSYKADHTMAVTEPMKYWGGYPTTAGFGIVTDVQKDFYVTAKTYDAIEQAFDKDQNTPDDETFVAIPSFTKVSYYVLPNSSSNKTTLLIAGAISATSNPMSDSWYPITVGLSDDDNTLTDADGNLISGTGSIEANKIYEISAIVAGPGKGSTGGDKPKIIVKTNVLDWSKVKQTSVIK